MPIQKLIETFGPGPVRLARAPGRVNLIGDHTDYCGGYVMPMAIDRDIRIAFRTTDDGRVDLVSLDFNARASFELSALSRDEGPGWLKYPMGVADVLQKEGHTLRGFQGVVKGDVPVAAGLSSSAAFEVVSAMVFCATSGLKINREKLALICQRAENEFVGMKCGIMDQYVSLLGRKGSALFLDCTALAHELVPLDEGKGRVVVCDSGVKRPLVESAYNMRREECGEAFKILKRHFPQIKTYRDVTVEMFKACGHDLPEPLLKRSRHVVTEDARVLYAVESLKRHDLIGFGALMDASHESLRNDFEVSCRELDLLVGLSRECHGTFGSRMTGAGFGGCTVSLVRPDAVDGFIRTVSDGYRAETGRAPAVYILGPADGAGVESERAK